MMPALATKNVELPVAIDRRLHHPLRVSVDRHIADHRFNLGRARAKILLESLQSIAINIGSDEPRAFADEELGGRPPDPHHGPGHQRHFSLQPPAALVHLVLLHPCPSRVTTPRTRAATEV